MLYAAGEGVQFCAMVSNLPTTASNPYISAGGTIFGRIVRQIRNTEAASSHPTATNEPPNKPPNPTNSAPSTGTSTRPSSVSGYLLELHAANGQVQRLLAFYPFASKPQVYIGTTFDPAN